MPKSRIAVIDYQMSNLHSVTNACTAVGLDATVISDASVLDRYDAAILPGVGAFGAAMENLTRLGLVEAIPRFIASGRPFLGICLGLHLLFSESEEFGRTPGLDVLKGRVIKFRKPGTETGSFRIPHMGWNHIYRPGSAKWDLSPLGLFSDSPYMYFVHSYYVLPDQADIVLCLTNYLGVEFCSGVRSNNILALQFHPEKSADDGMLIYREWARQI